MQATFKALRPGLHADTNYFVGRFLQRREQTGMAKEYLQKCATGSKSATAVAPVLAGIALREIEKKK